MTAHVILDLDRADRVGITEAVLCEPKTADQLVAVLEQADSAGRSMLLTRLTIPQLSALPANYRARIDYEEVSRTAFFGAPAPVRGPARVAVVTGGTSDIGVAREAVRALRFHGHAAEEIYDRRASGRHRVRRYGRRPADGARRARSQSGDRGADVGWVRRRRGRAGCTAQRAVELLTRPGGDQHRQRLRRGVRGNADPVSWMTN
jgi:hypothetical protein